MSGYEYGCPLDCQYRTPTCHSTCATYAEALARHRERTESMRRYQEKERICSDYHRRKAHTRYEPKRKER